MHKMSHQCMDVYPSSNSWGYACVCASYINRYALLADWDSQMIARFPKSGMLPSKAHKSEAHIPPQPCMLLLQAAPLSVHVWIAGRICVYGLTHRADRYNALRSSSSSRACWQVNVVYAKK